ncbi:hypothetical protein DICVIV_11682 [Dictyocaulus viviparus]|uniref:DUS-like FMN-binding domain-containing protein n=1 Tax=Dictyocaulus viviparus TaxID=29172 RepID=A0A0D8XJ20_DICVI|nr:hypothetical protein DICVIV_11682 [Dictyocaulus viviparus]
MRLILAMSDRKPKFYLAPMVRLAFRQLVRLYDVDCCYTPMIYARSFLESEHCRSYEFSTIPVIIPALLSSEVLGNRRENWNNSLKRLQ